MGKRFPSNGAMDVRVHGRYARLLLPPDDPDHISVDDLDTEELARLQLKDKNGKFTGRPPKFLPREIVDAFRREHYSRVNAILEESLSDMVKTMRAIALDKHEDGATRLKAAIYVFERFMGKTPDKINITKESTVEDIVDDILFDIDEKQKTEIEKELDLAQEELKRDPPRRRRTPAERMRERR
jgi:hypothetical protein